LSAHHTCDDDNSPRSRTPRDLGHPSAIYEAIIAAGFSVVAAHPVHAELRASSPKAAAKDPISLDAILVCRKRSTGTKPIYTQQAVIDRTDFLAEKLRAAELTISAGDYFVIAASQALVSASPEALSFEGIERRLKSLRLVLKESQNRAC